MMSSQRWLTFQLVSMYSHRLKIHVRGLCSAARQSYVSNVVKQERVDFALLLETKSGQIHLNMRNYACIVSRGSGGCMTLVHKRYPVIDVLQPVCGSIVACKICIEGETVALINVSCTTNVA